MSNSINGPRADAGEHSDTGLGSVVGYPSVVHRLRSIVIHPVKAAWAATPDVVAPHGLLLYGPPGDALAALRLAVAVELAADRVTFDASTGVLPAVTEPCVILLDRLDDLNGIDDLGGVDALDALDAPDGGRSARVVTKLFEQVAEIPAVRRPFTIATSVAPWHLDQALFSAGRLDRLAFVPPPGWEARSLALAVGAASRGLGLTERISLLAAATVGWAGADLIELLEQLHTEAADGPSEMARSSLLLDVVSRVVPRTRSWGGRARAMADSRAGDGMDDLVAWLRRAE